MKFKYQDAKGNVTVRELVVESTLRKDGIIYYRGVCNLRGEIRTFRSDRIIQFLDVPVPVEQVLPAESMITVEEVVVDTPKPSPVRRQRTEFTIKRRCDVCDMRFVHVRKYRTDVKTFMSCLYCIDRINQHTVVYNLTRRPEYQETEIWTMVDQSRNKRQ